MNALKIFQIISITIPIAFVLYLICRGKKAENLNYPQVISGLGIKIILGTIYGYIFFKYYNGDDSWYFFNESLAQSRLLLSDPGAFFKELSPTSAYKFNPGFISGLLIYLSDLEFGIQVKMLAVFNLLTFYDYYLDMCLLNGLFFFGHYLLFRVMVRRYPQQRIQIFLLVFCFFP